MSFHIQNNHHATLSQIDKANDHNSVCLLRGGIKREDLPADLSDISYPVNCYCSFKQSDLAFIPAYLTFDSNCIIVIISFTVPVHTKQARDLHPRIRCWISPLVRLCPSMWPAGQDQCTRHQPGNAIHMIIFPRVLLSCGFSKCCWS